MKLAAVLLAAAAAAPVPAWALYKCPAPGGGTAYQDAPCPGGAAMNIKTAPPSPAAANRARQELVDIEWRSKVQAAIGRGEPLVGMTLSELAQAMGAPTRVNASNYGGRQNDQMIYERRGETWFVYSDGARVTSTQHRPSIDQAPARAERCPNSIEIKNMETSAASITLSYQEKQRKLRELEAARRCR